MSQIAVPVPTSTTTSSMDARSEPQQASVSAASQSVLLPVAHPDHEQAAALPLAEMASLLTTGSPEAIELIEELDPDSDSERFRAVSGVTSVPPPFTMPMPTRPALTGPVERAELQIEDLSLRLDNPYRASSLIPPPRKGIRKGVLLTLCGVCAGAILGLVGSGYVPLPVQGSAPAAVVARPSLPTPAESLSPFAASVPVVASIASSAVESATPPAAPIPRAADAAPVVPTAAVMMVEPALAAAGKAERAKETSRSRAQRMRKGRRIAGRNKAKVAAPTPAATAPELPRSLARQDIIAAFAQLRPELTRCANGQHGVAEIRASILGTGRVSRPQVGGAFADSAARLCMERAVRNVSFPPFAEAQVSIVLPMAL